MTETTNKTTLRATLRAIRADLDGINYLSGPREYQCDKGTLWVRNADAAGGGCLLGVFVAELLGSDGLAVKKYKV